MAKLQQEFYATKKIFVNGQRKLQAQTLEITGDIENYGEWSYKDFEANLYIDGKFVAEISSLLAGAEVWTKIIDSITPDELLADSREQTEEVKETCAAALPELDFPKYDRLQSLINSIERTTFLNKKNQ